MIFELILRAMELDAIRGVYEQANLAEQTKNSSLNAQVGAKLNSSRLVLQVGLGGITVGTGFQQSVVGIIGYRVVGLTFNRLSVSYVGSTGFVFLTCRDLSSSNIQYYASNGGRIGDAIACIDARSLLGAAFSPANTQNSSGDLVQIPLTYRNSLSFTLLAGDGTPANFTSLEGVVECYVQLEIIRMTT